MAPQGRHAHTCDIRVSQIPKQQSASLAQGSPRWPQPHVPLPRSQFPEQHWALPVQPLPAKLQKQAPLAPQLWPGAQQTSLQQFWFVEQQVGPQADVPDGQALTHKPL